MAKDSLLMPWFFLYPSPMGDVSRLVELFDVSDATDEELDKIRDTFTLTCNEAMAEAMDIVFAGKFFGCPHSHLIIALQNLQHKFPCDECPPITPKRREMN